MTDSIIENSSKINSDNDNNIKLSGGRVCVLLESSNVIDSQWSNWQEIFQYYMNRFLRNSNTLQIKINDGITSNNVSSSGYRKLSSSFRIELHRSNWFSAAISEKLINDDAYKSEFETGFFPLATLGKDGSFNPPYSEKWWWMDDESLHSSLNSERLPNLKMKENIEILNEWKKTNPLPSPWFEIYKNMILKDVGATEMDFRNHPQACLVAVSSLENNPVDSAAQFATEPNIKLSLLNKYSWMDSNIPILRVMIHFEGIIPEELLQKRFRDFSKFFGSSVCRLIRIPQGISEMDIGELSLNLQLSDILYKELEKFFEEFAKQFLLLSIERKIQEQSEFVISQKKGFRNKLKSWWGSSSRTNSKTNPVVSPIPSARQSFDESSAPSLTRSGTLPLGAPIDNHYGPSSIEYRTRQLADILFMIQDYEGALTNYKYVLTDFKQAKMYRFSANTSKLISYCQLQMYKSSRDIDNSIEESISHYKKVNQRLVLDSAIFHHDLLLSRKSYKEAALALLSCTDPDDLNSALLTEQAAFCFLYDKKIRKYAFHMILAGYRYVQAANIYGQYRQSLLHYGMRCYIYALSVYSGLNWSLIEDHVFFTLSKHSYLTNSLDKSVIYMGSILGQNVHSAQRQSNYLREFLYIYKQLASESERQETIMKELDISLPVINQTKTIPLILEQTYDGNSESEIEKNRLLINSKEIMEEFLTMEDKMIQIKKHKKINLPLMMNVLKMTHHHRKNLNRRFVSLINRRKIGCVGEYIYVNIEFSNPIKIPIVLENITLHCELYLEDNQVHTEESNILHIDQKNITLQPLQTSSVRLSVYSDSIGLLKVVSCKYDLMGVVKCEKKFETRYEKLGDLSLHKKNLQYNDIPVLDISITQKMPKLTVITSEFPSIVLSGEVKNVVFTLRNDGYETLKGISIHCSHPESCLFGTDKNEISNSFAEGKNNIWDFFNIDLLNNQILKPGESIDIPITLRFVKTELVQFQLLFMYEPLVENEQLPYRTFCYYRNILVEPSVLINSSIVVNPLNYKEFTLSLSVETETSSSVKVQQISLVGKNFKLYPLWDNEDQRENQEIRDMGEITTLYQKIIFNKKSEENESVGSQTNMSISHVMHNKYLLFDSNDYFEFVRAQKNLMRIETIAPPFDEESISVIDPLFVDNKVDIMVFLEIEEPVEKQKRFLQLNILDISMSNYSLSMDNLIYSPAIFGRIECPSKIYWPSNNNSKFVLQDVNLLISNKISNGIIKCIISAPPINESYFWCGVTKKVIYLNSLEETIIPLTAAFKKPGRYDLSSFSIECFTSTLSNPGNYTSDNKLLYLDHCIIKVEVGKQEQIEFVEQKPEPDDIYGGW